MRFSGKVRDRRIESWAANLPSPSAYLKASIREERVQDEFKFSNALVAANVDGDSERDMA
jgi:hypothetical protein